MADDEYIGTFLSRRISCSAALSQDLSMLLQTLPICSVFLLLFISFNILFEQIQLFFHLGTELTHTHFIHKNNRNQKSTLWATPEVSPSCSIATYNCFIMLEKTTSFFFESKVHLRLIFHITPS